MQEYNTIIGNLFNRINRRVFKRFVDKYSADKYFKHFTTWVQFVVIFLGQILKNCNSLRDIGVNDSYGMQFEMNGSVYVISKGSKTVRNRLCQVTF